jgi:chromosome transmission fidelity protein 4
VEGNGYVAVATNTGVVRFFSGGGMQRGPVWAVDGEVVAMIGGRDYVFVVHREGGTSIDGEYKLSCGQIERAELGLLATIR